MPHDVTNFRDCLDGLSNTIAAGEIATDLGDLDTRTIGREATGATENGLRDNPSRCRDLGFIDQTRPQFWIDAPGNMASAVEGRGFRWADYLPYFGGCYTILPPNSELCMFSVTSSSVGPVSSRHQGGAHVLMGDGAVKFITSSIEAGNSRNRQVHAGGSETNRNAPGSPSPYGLWGALGTRASSEVIDEDF